MKVLVAPNAFKGSLSAPEVCRAITRGIRKVIPKASIIQLPLSDGGDGFLKAVLPKGTLIHHYRVTGPTQEPILAPIGFIESESTVIIESAQVIGLRLITSKISAKKITPLFTTSYGLGELIRYALDFKPRRIVVGLGGTATVDGGIGALSALGVKFLDRRGRPVELNGRGLGRIARVDLEGLDPRLHKVEIICACDVENPLLGPKGAARVYGPQKGANQKEVQSLEAGLRRFAQVAKRWTGKAIGRICYGGAAGGIPAGFYAFLDARLINGAEFCLERSKFNEQVKGVRLAITGEGRIDRQTVYGKLPIILARKLAGIPLIIIAGAVEDRKILSDSGIDFLFSIAPGPITLEESKSRASRLIQETVEAVVWLVKTFNGRKSS